MHVFDIIRGDPSLLVAWKLAMVGSAEKARFNRSTILKTRVDNLCSKIAEYMPAKGKGKRNEAARAHFPLYLTSKLLLGVVIIFRQQVVYLHYDANQVYELIRRVCNDKFAEFPFVMENKKKSNRKRSADDDEFIVTRRGKAVKKLTLDSQDSYDDQLVVANLDSITIKDVNPFEKVPDNLFPDDDLVTFTGDNFEFVFNQLDNRDAVSFADVLNSGDGPSGNVRNAESFRGSQMADFNLDNLQPRSSEEIAASERTPSKSPLAGAHYVQPSLFDDRSSIASSSRFTMGQSIANLMAIGVTAHTIQDDNTLLYFQRSSSENSSRGDEHSKGSRKRNNDNEHEIPSLQLIGSDQLVDEQPPVPTKKFRKETSPTQISWKALGRRMDNTANLLCAREDYRVQIPSKETLTSAELMSPLPLCIRNRRFPSHLKYLYESANRSYNPLLGNLPEQTIDEEEEEETALKQKLHGRNVKDIELEEIDLDNVHFGAASLKSPRATDELPIGNIVNLNDSNASTIEKARGGQISDDNILMGDIPTEDATLGNQSRGKSSNDSLLDVFQLNSSDKDKLESQYNALFSPSSVQRKLNETYNDSQPSDFGARNARLSDVSRQDIREKIIKNAEAECPYDAFFQNVVPVQKTSKRTAARSFYMLLEMAKEQTVGVSQKEPYGTIEYHLLQSEEGSESLDEVVERELMAEDFELLSARSGMTGTSA